jgi:hypothetical protein
MILGKVWKASTGTIEEVRLAGLIWSMIVARNRSKWSRGCRSIAK